jgi:hypothetical protein
MGGACTTHGENIHTIFWSENLKGRNHSEDLVVDGEINIRMDLREIGWQDVDWMHLGQDRPVARPCEYGDGSWSSVKGGGGIS